MVSLGAVVFHTETKGPDDVRVKDQLLELPSPSEIVPDTTCVCVARISLLSIMELETTLNSEEDTLIRIVSSGLVFPMPLVTSRENTCPAAAL